MSKKNLIKLYWQKQEITNLNHWFYQNGRHQTTNLYMRQMVWRAMQQRLKINNPKLTKKNYPVKQPFWEQTLHNLIKPLPPAIDPIKNRQIDIAWAILLAEVMLQQTTLITVNNRYVEFLAKFPNPETMAKLGERAVLDAWAGLGYYRRAKNLFRTALALQQLSKTQSADNLLPNNLGELKKLPGIGDYTSRAVLAFAFGQKIIPLDANTIRLMARRFRLPLQPPLNQKTIKLLSHELLPDSALPKDFAIELFVQGLMDAAHQHCHIIAPDCPTCPLNQNCLSKNITNHNNYWNQTTKPNQKPEKHVILLLYQNQQNEFFLTRQIQTAVKEKLWQGMLGFPLSVWLEPEILSKLLLQLPTQKIKLNDTAGQKILQLFSQHHFYQHFLANPEQLKLLQFIPNAYQHILTHRKLQVTILWLKSNFNQQLDAINLKNTEWQAWQDLNQTPLPSIMQRAVKNFILPHYQNHAFLPKFSSPPEPKPHYNNSVA